MGLKISLRRGNSIMMFSLFYIGTGCLVEGLYSFFVGDDFTPEDATGWRFVLYKCMIVLLWPLSFVGLLFFFIAEALDAGD